MQYYERTVRMEFLELFAFFVSLFIPAGRRNGDINLQSR